MCSTTRGPAIWPVLGDVADEDDSGAARLGVADQRLRGGAHLGDGARRALDDIGPQRLDGIDDDEIDRRAGLQRGEDVLHLRLGGERDRRVAQAEALGAQPDLADRLLAGDIDDAASGARQRGGDLDQDGRFADARIAADEERGARHEAAADDPVELADAGERARQLRRFAGERGERDRLAAAGAKRGRRGAGASSASVFHSPQASQRPCHFEETAPQLAQTYCGAGARHQVTRGRFR